MKKFDLEERLINFSVLLLKIVRSLPSAKDTNYLTGQLMRSGTSPALNYAEAQSAESRKDFIHKIKIVLKELRESSVCLRIIQRNALNENDENISLALIECDELIAIFVKSVATAQKNISESVQ